MHNRAMRRCLGDIVRWRLEGVAVALADDLGSDRITDSREHRFECASGCAPVTTGVNVRINAAPSAITLRRAVPSSNPTTAYTGGQLFRSCRPG
jgi:hypothetical protein